MKELEQREDDDEDYPVADWWEVQSDYAAHGVWQRWGRIPHALSAGSSHQALGQPLQSLKRQDFPSLSPPAAKNPSFAGSQITEEHKRPQKSASTAINLHSK